MSFASLTANLNLNISNFSRQLRTASNKMRAFTDKTARDYNLAAAALNKHNLHLKDTVRIVHGIVIAQAFYNAVGAISNATSALWGFNKELDYMQVTYSALFGNSNLASDFMKTLQEHSINTIFDYQGLADASKKLLAYGIEYENLMFIMNGLTDLGAMSGDKDSLTRIARALGQIYTKGKLSAEEMRQLADAYVPIYEIVQSSFGLTDDQMGRVGDLKLPAHEVINAVVDYANAEFGSVGDAAMYTITGLENRVVDTLKVMGTAMIQPITTAYKSFLAYVSNGLATIREEFDAGGFGAVFEHLVPDPRTQQTIRQFIANVQNLFMSLMSVGVIAGQVFGGFTSVLVTAFNIAAPIITGFTNVLAALLNAFLSTRTGAAILRVALLGAAGAFVVLKAHAIGALVITAVTKAVVGLSKALLLLASIVSKHPILSLIAGLAVALVGVSAVSNKANSAISGLFDTLSGASGASSDDVLQRTEQSLQDGANAADQFNNRLEEGEKKAEELEKGIGGVGSAAKDAAKKLGLLSFDEVFKLPDPASNSGSGGSGGAADAIEDFADLMGGIGDISDAFIPEIPDFTDYIDGFTSGLFGGLRDGLFDKIASAPGWLIGAGAGMAAAIAKAFGSSVGSVFKTLVNTGSFAGFFKSIGQIFSATGRKALLKGGIIGAAIGLVVDGLATVLWGSLAEKFESANTETAAVGQTIGSVIGAIIGGLLGGPPGAIIGSAIGTFAGGFVGLFWDPIAEYFDPENNVLTRFFVDTGKQLSIWGKDTLTGLAAWWTETYTGFSTWFSDTTAGFSGWWDDTKSGFSTWWSDTKSGLSSWWDDTVKTFSDWDSINSSTLGNWWSRTKTGFSDWASRTFTSLDDWAGGTLSSIVNWGVNTYNSFANWVGNTTLKIVGWQESTRKSFREWSSNALKPITDWCAETLLKFAEWIVNTKIKFDNFKADAKKVFEGIMISIGKAIDSGLSSVGKSIGDFFGVDNLWTLIKDGVNSITKKLKEWWKTIGDIFSGEISASPSVNVKPSTNGRQSMLGHASGGIFDREHIARFAEGNKREAIIPLENPGAMKPFVDAVSGGLTSTLAPMLASVNAASNSQLPPLYVGTLIADDRGIEQLYRKFQVIQLQENDRRGLPTT